MFFCLVRRDGVASGNVAAFAVIDLGERHRRPKFLIKASDIKKL